MKLCAWCTVRPQEVGVHCWACWLDLADSAEPDEEDER